MYQESCLSVIVKIVDGILNEGEIWNLDFLSELIPFSSDDTRFQSINATFNVLLTFANRNITKIWL